MQGIMENKNSKIAVGLTNNMVCIFWTVWWFTHCARYSGTLYSFTKLQRSACNLKFRNYLFLVFSVSDAAENKIVQRGQSYIAFENQHFIPESVTETIPIGKVLLFPETLCL